MLSEKYICMCFSWGIWEFLILLCVWEAMNGDSTAVNKCEAVVSFYVKYGLRVQGKQTGWDTQISSEMREQRSLVRESQNWFKIHWCVTESQSRSILKHFRVILYGLSLRKFNYVHHPIVATRELSPTPVLLKKGGETADGDSEYLARASEQINKGAAYSSL